MSKQICYNCVHNPYGEIRTIEGADVCYFDCKFEQELFKEDFEIPFQNSSILNGIYFDPLVSNTHGMFIAKL